jgi:transcriptional regulator with GAF, ATPase, and Fis domain
MSRGVASFLSTRPPKEALETVLKVLEESEWVQRKAAVRLGTHERTLGLWLKKHGFDGEVREKRAAWLAEQVAVSK